MNGQHITPLAPEDSFKSSQNLGLILGNSGHKTSTGDLAFQLLIVDLDCNEKQIEKIDLPFLGHGLAFHPTHKERAVVFEKRGKGACEIDLIKKTVLRDIPTEINRQFYGHGTYSDDGKILYSAETIIEGEFAGLIVMRNTDTLEELGHFPSYGNRPHDCQLLKDKRTMIITNGGGMYGEYEKGSVTWVDTKTRALIKKIPIENKKLNAGHVAVADSGDICVVSAPREGLGFDKERGGILIANKDGLLTSVKAPRKLLDALFGETLSVCIDNTNRTAVTMTPDAGEILFWDLDTRKIKHRLQVTHPRGVCMTQDKNYFVVNFGRPNPKLCMIDPLSFSIVKESDIDVDITGSHIVSIPKNAD
tara:strand:+ start:981 stop:2066 length:1086 start_codon:yes stop_codon:yes gene_type:complete